MKFVLEQTFHQNNCACQNDFYCFDAFGCIFIKKSRILIKISSKHKHSILMKKFDVFAPAFTSKLTLRIFLSASTLDADEKNAS